MKMSQKTLNLTKIINDVKMIIMKEPSLLEVPIPCVIVGDIHGQVTFFDDLSKMHALMNTLQYDDLHGATLRRYVFLGDYVDRGPNSLECICCLFAHKLIFPKMFNLLRGNHESAFINRNYGFYQELVDRFEEEMGSRLWCLFNDVFDLLPLAALVHKRILCMHGGLSPHLNSLDDIRKIIRPIKTMEESPLACDLLWSDPVVSLSGFVKNIVRGISVCFGEDSVLKACEKLNLDLIVRAHQVSGQFNLLINSPRYDAEKVKL
ncbi:unnamed protein product [Thelazia callipaeda]|uniref:Serine/threonine-protein phosphatase n=1 Tax=Thelazia callipaeda TaxID=103827 RepID=A0A0N5CWI0_THECL|nr:unnamed protein product [Thelazia callipaeda]